MEISNQNTVEQDPRRQEQRALLDELREHISVIEIHLRRAANGTEAIQDGGMDKLREVSEKLREARDFLDVL